MFYSTFFVIVRSNISHETLKKDPLCDRCYTMDHLTTSESEESGRRGGGREEGGKEVVIILLRTVKEEKRGFTDNDFIPSLMTLYLLLSHPAVTKTSRRLECGKKLTSFSYTLLTVEWKHYRLHPRTMLACLNRQFFIAKKFQHRRTMKICNYKRVKQRLMKY